MPTSVTKHKASDQISDFLARIYGMTREDFEKLGYLPELSPETTSREALRMPMVMAPKNQPEFWADAPWRLEPDQKEIRISFYIRDAEVDSPGFSPWRLDSLRVEQRLINKKWRKLNTYLPESLPNVDEQGNIKLNYWVFNAGIPKDALRDWHAGEPVHLRIIFEGSASPYDKSMTVERHLEVFLSRYALPGGRADSRNKPRRWFLGDPHYHSAYTNDIKEYGAPLPETRQAALSIGLDWIVVTDHSCDLVHIDREWSGRSRWERLKAELASTEISDDRFRFILGEEITLIGQDERFVHMLAMGNMQKVIPGAFLPEDSDSLSVDLWKNAIQNILRFGKGYPADLSQRLFGKLYHLEEVLEMLPAETLKFAAHPYSIAQVPPSKWGESDLAHPLLTGHEFWNTRSRRSAKQTENPFDRAGWRKLDTLKRKDESRIVQLYQYVKDKWEPHLIRGVKEWAPGEALPSRKPVFIGGSDSHGDFNYHAGMAWDYSKVDMVDDNSLGRVRTAIFLPDHRSGAIPEEKELLAAMKKGSCVVTDGPILEFHLRQIEQVAHMGEALLISEADEIVMQIKAYSTPEFGPVTQVELVSCFLGPGLMKPSIVILELGKNVTVELAGTQGYCRLQARTAGINGEQFCCFTNPIWIRILDGQRRSLRVSFA